MTRADELRQRAERYRLLKRDITDPKAVQAISELAAEYELTAEELERQHHIRKRAHELWMARGCPQGSPEVDWHEAVKELRSKALS